MPISHAGTPRQHFLPLKISCPKKRPFCDFSVFVLFYGLFRNFMILPKFFVHFRNRCVHFRNFRVRNWARNPRIYRNGRGRGICSDFVFILFILGNMIQKTEFVYYCRKKVKKSIAIKKNVVSLQCNKNLSYGNKSKRGNKSLLFGTKDGPRCWARYTYRNDAQRRVFSQRGKCYKHRENVHTQHGYNFSNTGGT